MGHLRQRVSRMALCSSIQLTISSGQWTGMFATLATDIGSDLPLWAVQDDFTPGVGTTTRFMGGWTKAFAKQYHLGKFHYSATPFFTDHDTLSCSDKSALRRLC